MAFNRYLIHISIRLVLILAAMFLLVLIIDQQGRIFSILLVSLLLLLLIVELFRNITRTNRIIESLLEAVLHGDHNRRIEEKVSGMGFEGLAASAQQIIRAIASARIEKETQYQYLQTILEHIHTAVITMDEHNRLQLINPIALHILGIYHTGKPGWEEIEARVPVFTGTLKAMGTSGREMVRLSGSSEGRKLLVLLNTVKLGGSPVRIVTFQDIEPEIEQQEMESWHTISRIMVDEPQLKQVLINLVKNAMEAMEPNPESRLDIRVKRILDRVIIEISDNGPGIPEELLEQVFVPFFSTKTEGSGIGLPLCRQIVKNHGGQISVKSEQGKGTTFRVGFPCSTP